MRVFAERVTYDTLTKPVMPLCNFQSANGLLSKKAAALEHQTSALKIAAERALFY